MRDTIYREDAIATIGVMYERCDTYDITDYRDLMLEAVKVLPSADRPQGEWIYHYRDKWMVKAECPKCHRRFEFSPRGIWKCCPMCETRMKGADNEVR